MACGDVYTESSLYEQQPVVRDGNLITAAGPASLDAWYLLHKEKQPKYYDALVASLPRR